MVNPLRADPSRTKTLRDKFSRELRKRLIKVKRAVKEILLDKDVFGLKMRRFNVVSNAEGEYSCVMLMLPKLAAYWAQLRSLLRLQSTLVNGSGLEDVEWETEPHVTVLYGLHPTPELESQLEELDWSPCDVEFGLFEVFENEDKDVVYLRVRKNPWLEQLNRDLLLLPNSNSHKDYQPHVTLGYFPPGTGRQIVDRLNLITFDQSITSDSYVLSNPQREQTVLNVEVLDRQFEFATDSQKIEEFEALLAEQVGELKEGEGVYDAYVREGYSKGAGRAWVETNRGKLATSVTDMARGFVEGRKIEFLVGMLNGPESVDKLRILAARTFKDVEGISDHLAKQLRQHLADGLVQGDNPKVIARRMFTQIDKTRKQSERIARTEIIRAHAEGQLDALERMGVDEVGVAVEYSTAGDDRVCPRCAPLEGVILKVKESHGLIPLHPHCRCSFLPAFVGEVRKGQVRTQRAIDKRTAKSVEAGSKLGDRRLKAETKGK